MLTEAEKREFMTRREQILKKRLIALLKDDGKGHKHAKYAERLADFDIKIVPLGMEPSTAAISFDEGIIYINEGFLSDPATFFQLNVLMRHEMAHNLLMHQVRLASKIEAKYGKEGQSRIKLSQSLHSLMNIIEDFEISNTRYTTDDKQIVRNMFLNGQLIGGLVTEDMRKNWEKLPLEQMYDELSQEISNLQQKILASWQATGTLKIDRPIDMIDAESKNMYYYALNRDADFRGTIADFIQNKALYHFIAFDHGNSVCVVKFSSLPEEWQKLVKTVYDAYSPDTVIEANYDTEIEKISKTGPMEKVDIMDPNLGEIIETAWTPEEKLLVTDILKALKVEKQIANEDWREKVKQALKDYSQADLQTILDGVNK